MSNPSTKTNSIAMVVLDWAGTMIDHGSLAPMGAFVELFSTKGVSITIEQARKPMGMAKREHIAALLDEPAIAEMWRSAHGRVHTEADVDELYADFQPIQKKTIRDHCKPIDGVVETVESLRFNGIHIGSTTGYTRELMDIVLPAAQEYGLSVDSLLCADDAAYGRPAPWLIYETARRFNIYPMDRVVKVDDTVVGIQAGRNAGAWTIGVSRSGNLVGLSEQELNALPEEERNSLVASAEQKLRDAGAHFVIESLAELPKVLAEIGFGKRSTP